MGLSFICSFIFSSWFYNVYLSPFILCFLAFILSFTNIISNNKFIVKPFKHNQKYLYLFLTLALSLSFGLDAFSYFNSKNEFNKSVSLFKKSFISSDNEKLDLLIDSLDAVNSSLSITPKNIDSILLKNEIQYLIFNRNVTLSEIEKDKLMKTIELAFTYGGSKYWKTWTRYGSCLALLGRYKEAENAFANALDIAPNCFEANYYMSSLLIHFPDKILEAKLYLEKALEIEPNNEMALVLKRKINL